MDKEIRLQKVIEQHQIWLTDRSKGSRAYLAYLDLSGLEFPYVDLRYADLSGADLSNSDLSNADLNAALNIANNFRASVNKPIVADSNT